MKEKDPIAEIDEHTPLSVGKCTSLIGTGWYQYRLMALLSGAAFLDGAQVSLASATVKGVLHDVGIAESQQYLHGITLSIFFIGAMIGNVLGGLCGDQYGRRPVAIIGLVVMIICAGVQSQIGTLGAVLFSRLSFGIAIGVTGTINMAMILEMCSAKQRAIASNIQQSAIPAGEIFCAVLMYFMIPELDASGGKWRMLSVYITIPPLLCLPFMIKYLDESPAYLFVQNRQHEAMEVLTKMAETNKSPVAPILRNKLIQAQNASGQAGSGEEPHTDNQLVLLDDNGELKEEKKYTWMELMELQFSSSLWMITVGGMFIVAVVNFNNVGVIYVLPQILSDVSNIKPAASLLICSLMLIPACFLTGEILIFSKHRYNFIIAFMFVIMAVMSFLVIIPQSIVSMIFICICKCLVGCVFVIIQIYLSECFPSVCRATGTGMVLSGGRLGAIAGPFVFDAFIKMMDSQHKGINYFMVTLASILLSAAIVLMFMPEGEREKPLRHRSSVAVEEKLLKKPITSYASMSSDGSASNVSDDGP